MPSFLALIFLKILWAFLVNSYFIPDEYWQSLEVAYSYVYGSAYLTWEWSKLIRSFTLPLIYSIPFQVLKSLGLDNRFMLILSTKIINGLVSGTTDYYTIKLGRLHGLDETLLTFVTTTSLFNLFLGPRSTSNTFETCLFVCAIYYLFLMKRKHSVEEKKACLIKAVIATAISCMIRPTAIIFMVYPAIDLVINRPICLQYIMKITIIILIVSVSALICIDTLFYKKIIFTPINFFIYNITYKVSHYYGVKPFFQYFLLEIPLLLTSYLPLFVIGLYKNTRTYVVYTTVVSVGFFSLLAHKETRFIQPILPILIIYSTFGLTHVKSNYKKIFKLVVLILLIANLVPAIYLCCFQKTGVVYLTKYLHNELKGTHKTAGFLMPCHSTPMYSHIQIKNKIWIVECNPITTFNKNYRHLEFTRNPREFVKNEIMEIKNNDVPGKISDYSPLFWPNYLIMFHETEKEILDILQEKGYRQIKTITNSYFFNNQDDQSKYIVVYYR